MKKNSDIPEAPEINGASPKKKRKGMEPPFGTGAGPGMGPPGGMDENTVPPPETDISMIPIPEMPSGSNYVNGMIPPAMRTIAPDYAKWRRQLLFVNLALAVIVFLLEAVLLVFTSANGLLLTGKRADMELWECVWQFLLFPSLVNFSIVGLEAYVLKKAPRIDRLQNNMVMLTMTVICTVSACVHYDFENTMTALCLPVLTSVVFCSKQLTLTSGIASAGGLIVTVLCRVFVTNGEDTHILPEAVIAFVMLALSEFIAGLVNGLMFEQRMKLVGAISEAKKAQSEAVGANNAKSEFLANMSHEIRTPINAILGMNEMILREERNPNIRGYAANIQSSGNSLLTIINDVLDISKIESGRMEITNASYDISSLINDCYNMAADRARAKELELKVECSEDIPRLLLGDEVHLRQVIVNLLTNAVKYTEKGTVTLSVESSVSDDFQFILAISVRDTGIGISKEDLDDLFVQFKRFDLKHNRNIEGTGLGLTIVKQLVDLMGGTIVVKSNLGEGSEFTVYIPQEIVDETPAGSIQLNYSRSAADYQYTHKFEAPEARILVVDDLPMNLMVITNMLKESRMKIDTASSGREAIELCEMKRYHLILMDHMMPEMDGIEAFMRLRADTKTQCADTPVIMLTANALAGVRDRYMNVGFTDYISKPVRGDRLEKVIMTHLPANLLITDIKPGDNAEEPSGGSEYPELAPLLEALPHMNMALAMPYCCGSMDLFREILRDYASNTRYEDMQAEYNEGRFDDYRRDAHSLKSTSLTIGLEGLSERARASEFALKCGNMELVKMNHPELMQMYADALEKIRAFLQ